MSLRQESACQILQGSYRKRANARDYRSDTDFWKLGKFSPPPPFFGFRSFIEDYKVIDKIIDHLKLTFMAERPPPPQVVQQELMIAAEEREEYF